MNIKKELQKVKNLRQKGAFHQAINHLEKIISKVNVFEDRVQLNLELGQIWLELDENDKALLVLEQTLAQFKNRGQDPSLLTLKRRVALFTSIAYQRTGNLVSASKLGRGLISAQPVDAITIQAYQNLGDIKFLQGKFKKSTALFKRALKLDPDFKHLVAHDIFYKLGKSYIPLKQFSKARHYLEKATKTFESGRGQIKIGSIYVVLAEYLSRMPGSKTDAIDYYQQLIALFEPQLLQRKLVVTPDVAASLLIAYYRIGEFHLIKDEYQEAIDYFVKAVNTGSQNPKHLVKSYQLLGTSYLRNGNNRKAQNIFKQLLKIDPEQQWVWPSWLYRDFGLTYHNQGKYKEANKYLLKALELEQVEPSELLPDIHKGLGYTYFFSGNFDLAAQHCRLYLEMGELTTSERKTLMEFLTRATITTPHFPGSKKLYKAMTHLESGLAFEENEHFPEARIEFEQVLKLDPHNSSALYGLGRYYYEVDDQKKAFFWLNKSLEKQANYAPTHYYLGQLYYKHKRDFQKALASFKKALETNFDEDQVADIHLALAASYRELGQTKEALQHEA